MRGPASRAWLDGGCGSWCRQGRCWQTCCLSPSGSSRNFSTRSPAHILSRSHVLHGLAHCMPASKSSTITFLMTKYHQNQHSSHYIQNHVPQTTLTIYEQGRFFAANVPAQRLHTNATNNPACRPTETRPLAAATPAKRTVSALSHAAAAANTGLVRHAAHALDQL